jgi:hypothetical protein
LPLLLTEKIAEKAIAITTNQYSDLKNNELERIIHEEVLMNHVVLNIS